MDIMSINAQINTTLTNTDGMSTITSARRIPTLSNPRAHYEPFNIPGADKTVRCTSPTSHLYSLRGPMANLQTVPFTSYIGNGSNAYTLHLERKLEYLINISKDPDYLPEWMRLGGAKRDQILAHRYAMEDQYDTSSLLQHRGFKARNTKKTLEFESTSEDSLAALQGYLYYLAAQILKTVFNGKNWEAIKEEWGDIKYAGLFAEKFRIIREANEKMGLTVEKISNDEIIDTVGAWKKDAINQIIRAARSERRAKELKEEARRVAELAEVDNLRLWNMQQQQKLAMEKEKKRKLLSFIIEDPDYHDNFWGPPPEEKKEIKLNFIADLVEDEVNTINSNTSTSPTTSITPDTTYDTASHWSTSCSDHGSLFEDVSLFEDESLFNDGSLFDDSTLFDDDEPANWRSNYSSDYENSEAPKTKEDMDKFFATLMC